LLYDDPLRIFVKATELDLPDLANSAANATLNIDLAAVPGDTRRALASMPVIWLWRLLDLRKERTTWLLNRCGSGFRIAKMGPQYHFSPHACECMPLGGTSRNMPASFLDMIKAYPCARAIRKIDFNVELKCLRCGGAAIAHFNTICDEYEKTFGIF